MSAAEVLKGKYKEMDNLPDEDLGKSITPGFRNLSFSVRIYDSMDGINSNTIYAYSIMNNIFQVL